MKALESKLRTMRKSIEGYMEEKSVSSIRATDEAIGSISREEQNRPVVSARYTSYDKEDVLPFLSAKTKKTCLVEVVDTEILELLVKLGEIDESVLEHEVTKPVITFSVKK